MKPEDKVVSKNIAEKLKELGFPQDTERAYVGTEVWDKTMQSDYETSRTPARNEWVAAPDIQEINEALPEHTEIITFNGKYVCFLPDKHTTIEARNELEARAKFWMAIKQEQNARCKRGACLTKDRVIHNGEIVCRYCMKKSDPCLHPKSSTCTLCDKSNLETV